MIARILVAAVAGLGVYLIVSDRFHDDRQRGPGRRIARRARGLYRQRSPETFVAAAAGSILGLIVFGGLMSSAAMGLLGALVAWTIDHHRERRRRQDAADAWPRLIEQIRISVTTAGQSIPVALFEAGLNGPAGLHDGFRAAHREWLLTGDLDRALAALTTRLDDATADTVCETLLVAHQVGGTGIGPRLDALANDRRRDLHERKDAHARMAGARFARTFVLLVPAGMAAAGLSIGNGSDAYRSGPAQIAVTVAVVVVGGCWLWASALMRLPTPPRVYGNG